MAQFSGIQPTGLAPHLGNFLGGIRRWAADQESEDKFCVVDLHAMTTPFDPALLARKRIETAAWLIAAGINNNTSCLFVQSAVPEHSELMWLVGTQLPFGELARMTQFKEKGAVGFGLFSYPVLMAADILLYRATHVPIGADQVQHLELARRAARSMNELLGAPYFPQPEATVAPVAARVRDLRDPDIKMSKSSPSDAGTIWLSDDADTIARKVRRATTDTDAVVCYAPDRQPGLANLIEIIAALMGVAPGAVVDANDGSKYGTLKDLAADLIIHELAPIQDSFADLIADPATVAAELERGASAASVQAHDVMSTVRDLLHLPIRRLSTTVRIG